LKTGEKEDHSREEESSKRLSLSGEVSTRRGKSRRGEGLGEKRKEWATNQMKPLKRGNL